MHGGTRIFAALGGDLEPLLACGWLLSMIQGTAVTVGLPQTGPGGGPCARGFMDLHVLRREHDDDMLLRAAAAQARRLAALLPGDGALELSRDPPVGNFDLLLVARPPVGRSLAGNPAYWTADAKRFGAVLVAPRETPSRLGQSVTILADGPPRDLKSFGIARRLFPTIESVHLILRAGTCSGQDTGWLDRLNCRCPVRISTLRWSAAVLTAAIAGAGGDLLVVERPARSWHRMGFEWRLSSLLDHTPGAMLFAL